MEAALISGVLKIAGEKLVSLIGGEFTSIMGVKKDLSELQQLFREITGLMSAVGDRATGSDPSSYWLRDLKDAAYDFDDLLNKVHLEAEKHKAGIDGDKHVMANWFRAKPKSGLSRLVMAHKIKKIKKRFAKIVKQRTNVNSITNAIATSSVVEHPIQRTNKIIGEISVLENKDETEVLGRDKVRREIICKLVEADTQEKISIVSTQEKISIVSIVGLGGSGKTTLAKYICQDSKIKEHFEVMFWVHVSQEFDVEKLIRKLFESVADKKSELHTLQHMIEKISEKLSGKKFLLVLDDIWNENPHDWEQFEQRFNSGAPGSKILLTTRDGKVAEVAKSKEIVNLSSLSDDESWKLFQLSSGWAEEGLDAEFIEVGKEIVKKCAGVPLAIKSLAGVLFGKREIKYWQTLRDDNLLSSVDIEGRVLGSLKLSYLRLSDDLKQCFVLCSIFPKGSYMYKHHLTSQWRAHGFANPVNGSRHPEDIASDFFDSLLKVSFLQDLVEYKDTGRLCCKMHDLVHDLSRQILQDELVLTPEKNIADHNQRCRYLSLASCAEKIDRKLFNKVRALYVTGGSFATDKPIKKGGCVRSVILEYLTNASFPMSALKFEYLGYLRISNVGCTELPSAISGCWNLQALHIIRCYNVTMLPDSIGKLKRLRTLELTWIMRLESLPQSIGDCDSLESLHLRYCEALKEIPDSIGKNEMLWVLDIVYCYKLCQLPSESFRKLRNLQSINMTGCTSLKELPGTLASNELHTMRLHGMSKLTILPQCITSLSSLKHLNLGNCEELAELPEGIVNLQKLEVLNLKGCHKLSGLPAGFGQLTRLRKLGLFVIGDSSEHARISELGNLDMLSSVLEIKGIKYLKDPDDAEKAYLKKKKNIQKLVLKWSSIETDAEEEVDMEQEPTESDTEEEVDMKQELVVLNGLEPPSGIKKLEIRGYQGLHSPCWMTKERHSSHLDSKFKQTVDLSCFPHLIKMKLYCFPRLKHLSGLTRFPSLKTLELSGFDALESISAGPFPSLTELRIYGMPHLLELSTTTRIALADEDGVIVCGNQESQCCFPRLSTLHIESCLKLNVRPWFLPSLESLKLERNNEQLLFPGSSFQSVHRHGDISESPPSCSSSSSNGAPSLSLLKDLVLRKMTGPSACSGWELLRHLTALESLEIRSCHELRQLPESMRSLTSLKQLEIRDCNELRQLPESMRSLTSLKQLDISFCFGLHELPEWLGELQSLQRLEIRVCRNLREFPEGIQHLTSLQVLRIGSCDLHQLPEGLGGLLSLRRLSIDTLPGLSCLPESMRGLTSLQVLRIGSCDLHQLPEGLGGLLSLRRLSIDTLPGLSCLPESMRGLTSLQSLHIGSCDSLHRLPEWLGELRSLQNFQISSLHALTCLPRSMQRLTSLHDLSIIRCDALTVLPEWMGQLSALQSLKIWGCSGLTSLPSSIQRLAALQTLEIRLNPDVTRRCKQGEGEDWHLISHIPTVCIT